MRNDIKSPSRPRRGRPREFDEAAALDAITDLFRARGFAGTSLDALSAAAGVARPSLYATFGDKEAMYLAGLENFFARVDAAVAPAVERGGTLQQVLGGVFDALIDLYTAKHRGEPAMGCLIVCTASAEAVSTPAVRHAMANLLGQIDARLAGLLRAAQACGELDAGTDVETLAAVLAGVTHSLAVRARAGQDKKALRRIAAAAVAAVTG